MEMNFNSGISNFYCINVCCNGVIISRYPIDNLPCTTDSICTLTVTVGRLGLVLTLSTGEPH